MKRAVPCLVASTPTPPLERDDFGRKRHRAELEREEAEKEAALEAALFKAARTTWKDGGHIDHADIAALVLKTEPGETVAINDTCDPPAVASTASRHTFRPRPKPSLRAALAGGVYAHTPATSGRDALLVQPEDALEAAMLAHAAKLKQEQYLREEEEREAMAEEMRKIAELELEAAAIEREAKLFEAQRMEQLEREALAFEEEAAKAESRKLAMLARQPADSFAMSFAFGPRWNVGDVGDARRNTSSMRHRLPLPPAPSFVANSR